MKLCSLCVDTSINLDRYDTSELQDFLLLDKPESSIVNKLSTYKRIFIKVDYICSFFQHFYHHLGEGIVIVTHNGDYGITEQLNPIINLPKISKWYAQNTHIEHPKLITIPIGLPNPNYSRWNRDALKEIIHLNLPKTNLLYVNFNVDTNVSQRRPIMDLMIKKGYKTREGCKPVRSI